MNPLTQLMVLVLALFGAVIIFKLLKKVGKAVKYLLINSVLGLVTLYVLSLLGLVTVPINLFTLLVVALGGLWGVLLLIVAGFLHILV
ncbi:MAG: pro-sigmaK processing inhibitor BofA family protein [Candidatus Altiarchaeota archaeon]|nr:pro-sigmaK processing inhibitor BofA family protein [Candidatus Altiarchaeota archaeon]